MYRDLEMRIVMLLKEFIATKKYIVLYSILFFFLLFCSGSYDSSLSSSSSEPISELILLWANPPSIGDAVSYLDENYPELTITEHFDEFSICTVSEDYPVDTMLSLLSRDDRFVLAEPNYSMELMDIMPPDDPYLDTQWAINNSGSYIHYYGSLAISRAIMEDVDMNVLEAWNVYPLAKEDTQPVIVAIIDTGVDVMHPDLQSNIWSNPYEIPENGIDDDGNGYVDDINGWDFYHNDATVCHYQKTENGHTALPEDNDNHGTHCAGIIAGVANNDIGIAGIASNINVQIMSLKIHGGTSASGSIANAIKAIRYAEDMGASICNISWGTANYSQTLELAIQESSMLFVTAAGNSGNNNNSTPIYPASFRLPNLISVAFVDAFGQLSSSSNYGLSTVDLAAPGQDIYSTIVGGYGYSSGSSMAAPHVAALAAMIYAYRDDIYAAQVKELIINTIKPIPSLDGYLIHPGIPDALLAIQSLDTMQFDHQTPNISISTTYEQDMICLHVSAYDAGISGLRRIKYIYGTKPADFFTIESNGNILSGDKVLLTKAGYYTFYVEDYAGNYTLFNYSVEDDTTPPEATYNYVVSQDYTTSQITFNATDLQSGIKTASYIIGEYSLEDFRKASDSVPIIDGSIVLELPSDTAAVTFYVLDNRGNYTLTTVHPKVVPATSVHPNVLTRTMSCSETYQLRAMLFPWNTTDGITFRSLDPTIISVDETGLVTAVSPGETFVFITTYSGVQRACYFIVEEPLIEASSSVLEQEQSEYLP